VKVDFHQVESYLGLAIKRWPKSIIILIENVVRHNSTQGSEYLEPFKEWLESGSSSTAIEFKPARVLMQDFTGVPAVVDLAVMRDAMVELGGNPADIDPLCPVDLVVDHSVNVDEFGHKGAFNKNVQLEIKRNLERYQLLKWAQGAFNHFNVVPPGTGICHQVNLEKLACVVQERDGWLFPDTCIGTDSHTTMINGLSVLGWGVGGIEAEAAMLGQPVSMRVPEVVGVELKGSLPESATATDLVLTLTNILRDYGVVGKFVEFFGEGVAHLSLAERATISNMSPEFGSTCAFFGVDEETLRYLKLTGREDSLIMKVKEYAQHIGLWYDHSESRQYSSSLSLDLSTIEACIAGPKRPQDRVKLSGVPAAIHSVGIGNKGEILQDGDIVVAAITSCTNTSNPSVLIAAGLLAKRAVELGIKVKPWVKTSLAPGSKVVMEYLHRLDLIKPLEQLGFYLVGFGCTTCIGNSGPLPPELVEDIEKYKLSVSAVLSGNRNFEGRVHPLTRANWLASPPLVVAYALVGHMRDDLTKVVFGTVEGKAIHLKDIWPSKDSIEAAVKQLDRAMFIEQYRDVFKGDDEWRNIVVSSSSTYEWQKGSTYIRQPGFFEGMTQSLPKPPAVNDARILALLGDSVTTDHISPAGVIKHDSPAGEYLQSLGVAIAEFNSYGSRRGNFEVMTRGTFANIRIRNEITPEIEGGYTRYFPSRERMSIYHAAEKYQQEQVPLVVIAGKEYGTGSSRDWAAKGTLLLGVKAVIAESYERIHRSNLIGMGVMPCVFEPGTTRRTLNLTGDERIDLVGIENVESVRAKMTMVIHRSDGESDSVPIWASIETLDELAYFRNGGILPYVLRKLVQKDGSIS
jgi:aconitate hydratase